MHRDKKLGLGLGVLLLGIVGAFFFRNDLQRNDGLPQLANPEQIDSEIAEKPTIPYLTGLEADPPVSPPVKPAATRKPKASRAPAADPAPWAAPDFLQASAGAPAEPATPRTEPISFGPPDPISTQPVFDDPMPKSRPKQLQQSPPAPRHNVAWDVVPEPRVEATPRPAEVSSKVVSQSRPVEPAKPRAIIHRVAQGDTLSGLASRYLGSGNRFMDIYRANQDILKSPDDLRIGMQLRIPTAEEPQSNRIQREQRESQEFLTPGPDNQPFGSTGVTPASPASHAVSPFEPSRPAADQTPQPAELGEPQFRRFIPARRSPLVPRGADNSKAGDKAKDAPRLSDSENPFEPAGANAVSSTGNNDSSASPDEQLFPEKNPFERVATEVSERERETVRR